MVKVLVKTTRLSIALVSVAFQLSSSTSQDSASDLTLTTNIDNGGSNNRQESVCGSFSFKNPTHCMDYGQYVQDDDLGPISTTAPGFYSYSKGEWKQDVEYAHDLTRGHGWYWELPSSCKLTKMKDRLFCDIMHRIHAKHHKERNISATHSLPRLAFVGDSITVMHFNYLKTQLKNMIDSNGVFCGIQMTLDHLHYFDVVDEPKNVEWIHNICNSDVAVINQGAHFSDPENYRNKMREGIKALFSVCGDDIRDNKIKVYFRSTVEGNPLCCSSKNIYDLENSMEKWNSIVWPVIIGNKSQSYIDQYKQDVREEMTVLDKFLVYQTDWHWEHFQKYNQISVQELSSTNIHFMDVVALSRLRPTADWPPSSKIKGDCLHGNRAVSEWNTMLMNLLGIELCKSM